MAPKPMDPMDRFDEALKSWAKRPPHLPAEQAAGRVLNRLAGREKRRSRPIWLWANALATVVLATILTIRFYPSSDLMPPLGDAAEVSYVETPPIPDGVVVMWLDAETPLYLTMNIPATNKGEPSI